MTEKLNIIMTPFSIFLSHVLRCLAVAESLRSRGHNVSFVACEKYASLIRQEGFPVILCDHGGLNHFVNSGTPVEYKKRKGLELEDSKKALTEIMQKGISIYEKYKPDLIISDGGVCMISAFLKHRFPMVEIRNHIGLPSNTDETELSAGNESNAEYEFDIQDIKKLNIDVCDAVRDSGVPLKKYFQEKYGSIPIIIPGLSAFEVTDTNHFEARKHKFVGPLTWNKWHNSDIAIPSDKKVIMASFGSSFPFEKLTDVICEALDSEDYFVIINSEAENTSYVNTKANVVFRKYLNFDEVLPHVDVIIHHSGHGTVMHALKFGVPCIAIPYNGDQHQISKNIEELGLGLRIKKYPDEITPDDIIRRIQTILSENIYKRNAVTMSEKLKEIPDPAYEAVMFIEDYYSHFKENTQTY